jgi:hypothetical protein
LARRNVETGGSQEIARRDESQVFSSVLLGSICNVGGVIAEFTQNNQDLCF